MKSAINRMRSLMVYQVAFRLIATIFCSLVITFFILSTITRRTTSRADQSQVYQRRDHAKSRTL